MYNAIASTGVTGGVALGTEEVWNAKQLLKRLATILADGKRRPMPYALARTRAGRALTLGNIQSFMLMDSNTSTYQNVPSQCF